MCRDNLARTQENSAGLADEITGPTNPRDCVSPKVCNFLILAQKHGFFYAWVDTCCIDKTSSAELTEAINSMFRYYALSEVCYVYLNDVPADCDPTTAGDGSLALFARSGWHRRGWTLQELLASKTVIFISSEWTVLGDKYNLAPVLEKVTSVRASVLRFEQDIADISVAERMSWAANRRTTRVEDEAYCLFGLFGINLPTLYGEGRNAFYRLQEEILRTSLDTSLFAWGPIKTISGFEDLRGDGGLPVNVRNHGYAFAPSPRHFKDCYSVSFPGLDTDPSDTNDSMFTLTPRGIRTRAPVVHLGDRLMAAKLLCHAHGSPVWMLLRAPENKSGVEWPGGWRRLGHLISVPIQHAPSIPHDLQNFYLCPRPSFRSSPANDPRSLLLKVNADVSAPYRIKPHLIAFLDGSLKLVAVQSIAPEAVTGDVRATLEFVNPDASVVVTVLIGRCMAHASHSINNLEDQNTFAETQNGAHYFSMQYNRTEGQPSHDCPADHLALWQNAQRDFAGHIGGNTWLRVYMRYWVSPLSKNGETLEFDANQYSLEPSITACRRRNGDGVALSTVS